MPTQVYGLVDKSAGTGMHLPVKLYGSTSSTGPWTEIASFDAVATDTSGAAIGSSSLSNNGTVYRYLKLSIENASGASVPCGVVLSRLTLLGN